MEPNLHSVPKGEGGEADSGAVCLGLEAIGEDDRDAEAAIFGSPSFAKSSDDGSGFGCGVEADALRVDADADEAVQGAKSLTGTASP